MEKIVRRLRGEDTQKEFAKKIGVKSAATICFWERGATSVDPFNRMRLLDYARRSNAAADLVAALEKAQEELHP